MELKEARYILAIARHQSIGKAAESLYISQPSLSKYLKNLEERLGAPLFSRHENRYYPTYMGERYLTTPNRSLPAVMSGCRNTTISLTASAAA